MFNFNNLCDYEFEELCKDIMERKLDVKLRIFAKGRDGGIDLTDNPSHNIIIQVKHYINSTFANLRTTLRREKENVKRLKPNQYYICCAMRLSEANVTEIYGMFSDYMESFNNIITLSEINEFLSLPCNIDIVRKNYKLWLESSNILSEIYNQNIFIDCEALLGDINEESKFFVKTNSYEKCLDVLEKRRMLLLIGAPGVGKTIISKMLIIYLADKGYKVRYTTNGVLTDLKNALSVDKDAKEIILLDDCLGQHYFDIKSTQENELLSLIKYVSFNPNKMIILNSRITIFNEAKERSDEFRMYIEDEKIKLHIIDISQMSSIDKAKIFYNHLVFKGIPRDYYENIKVNRNYHKIINHSNYTPRIIEYVTKPVHYTTIEPHNYCEYIINSLDTPNDIWKNEFERRMGEIDRIFMNTLYSLTDTTIKVDVMKVAFENRIAHQKGLDTTINNFEYVIKRLLGSTISIYDNKGSAHIGVINPSVNDYLKSYLSSNLIESNKIKDAIIFHCQLLRNYSDEDYEKIMQDKVGNGTILDILFDDDIQMRHYIVHYVSKYLILNSQYLELIPKFLNDGYSTLTISNRATLIKDLFTEPLSSYYKTYDLLEINQTYNDVIKSMDLRELVDLANVINDSTVNTKLVNRMLDDIIKTINIVIDEYGESIQVSDYCDGYDMSDILSDFGLTFDGKFHNEDEAVREVVRTLRNWVLEDFQNEIEDILYELPEKLQEKINLDTLYVNDSDIEQVVSSYMESYYDYDDDEHGGGSYHGGIDIIDIIFDR